MKVFLSHYLSNDTPTYGNRTRVSVTKLKSKSEGSTVNESVIYLPLHAGTHIDFPKHFYSEGNTIEDYSADFWFFANPLVIAIETDDLIIDQKLIDRLIPIENKELFDIIIVKTGAFEYRDNDKFWSHNHGIGPKSGSYIRENFPNVRILGMDNISLTSFQDSSVGKAAHLEYLNPKSPILLIEDMNLSDISEESIIEEIIIAPFLISGSDGVPVSCLATVRES